MLIISVRGNGNNRWKKCKKKQNKTKNKKQRHKRTKENRRYSERVRAKWFCCDLNAQQNHLALTLSL